MSALTENRTDLLERAGRRNRASLGAGATIFAGAMVAINDAGFLVPATADTTLAVVATSKGRADNSGGADGDVYCEIARGVFNMKNSEGGDAIALAQIGQPVFVVDDQTVAKTDGAGTRPAAGVLAWFDSDGPWVRFE